MKYRWKPNASQKREYIEKMKEKESLNTFTTQKAIRNGCFLKFYNITQGRIDNYPLEQGNNYLKVPAGTHILYWNKEGVNHSREITISSQNNKFILF